MPESAKFGDSMGLARDGVEMKRKGPVVFIALMIIASAWAMPAIAGDASLENRLRQENLRFTIDGDGDYKTTFTFTDDRRTQLVFVSGRTENVLGVHIREIFSPAAKMSQDGVNGTQALALMEKSARQQIGAWEIRSGVLYFVIKYPEPIPAAFLHRLMNTAGATADNMEIEISGSEDAL